MTLQDLMNIQVGKRYCWKPKPVELLCSHCNEPFWSKIDREPKAILIISKPGRDLISCDMCGAHLDMDWEGWYVGTISGDYRQYVVPYTQLSRIEEENYD